MDAPESLCCPISSELFNDAVLLRQTGQLYDRSSILNWFRLGKSTCPSTGVEVVDQTLIPVPGIAGAVEAWRDMQVRLQILEQVDQVQLETTQEAMAAVRTQSHTAAGAPQHFDEASFADLSSMAMLGADDPFMLRYTAAQKLHQGNCSGALNDLNRIPGLCPHPDCDTLLLRAAAKHGLRDFVGELRDLDKADVLRPDCPSIISRKGIVKYLLKDPAGALPDLERASQLQAQCVMTALYRGLVRYSLANYHGAITDLDFVEAKSSGLFLALKYRGAAKMRLEASLPARAPFPVPALADLDRAFALQQSDSLVCLLRGAAHQRAGNFALALQDLERAAKLESSSSHVYKVRGAVHCELGDHAAALLDFDRADAIEPDDVYTLQCRGACKINLNDMGGGLRDLDQAKRLQLERCSIADAFANLHLPGQPYY